MTKTLLKGTLIDTTSTSDVSNDTNLLGDNLTEVIENLDAAVVHKAGAETITGPKTFTDTTTFQGDVIQQGTTYTTHAEQVYTTKDTIIMRDGALTGLADGVYAGLTAKLYDGVNDGQLVFDNKGVARVGDVGSLQPIATREEVPTDGYYAKWSFINQRFETAQVQTNEVVNNSNVPGTTSTDALNNIVNGTATFDSIKMNTTLNAPPHSEGTFFYDKVKHTMAYYTDDFDVTVNIGFETLIRVFNPSATDTVVNGTIVYPNGHTNTGEPTIGLADASDYNKCRLVGVATSNIPPLSFGTVTKFGSVSGLDTSGYAENTLLYLSASIPGGMTIIRPDDGAFLVIIGAIGKSDATNGNIIVDILPASYTVETLQNVGWSRKYGLATFNFNAANRTLTLNAVGSTYHYYDTGEKFSKITDSFQITDIEGRHLVYYDKDTIKELVNPTESQINSLIESKSFITLLYWNATDKKEEYVGYELHDFNINPAVHAYLHKHFRTRYAGGYTLTNINADASGNLNTSAQFGVTSGTISDDGLETSSSDILSTTGLLIGYISGTQASPTLRTISNPGYAVSTIGSGRLAYNTIVGGNWVRLEAPNNSFVLCHVFAINENSVNKRVVAVMGQKYYNTISDARAGAQNELLTLQTTGVSPSEIKSLYTIIFETADNNNNAVKARIRSVSTGVNAVDWRATYLNGTSAGGASAGAGGTIFNDSLFRIFNNIDSSKQIAFDASNIATGLTRTIYMPNTNVYLQSVGTSDSPSFNGLTVVGTITGSISGNANTATTLQTSRTISISGGAVGTATSFNGSTNITIPITSLNSTYLNDSGVVANTYGSATSIPVFAVSSKGIITSVTNTTISGLTTSNLSASAGITNSQLANSSVTIGTTSISLGSSSTTLAGLTSITATTFNGSLTGNASTSTKLATARNISLTGDVTGSASFDGSADTSITATVTDNSHNHTSANISDATNLNTANMIVKRDASGNFSAGTITANLSGNASTATTSTNVSGGTVSCTTFTSSSTNTFNALTATTVPYLNASKQLTSSSVTPTELGYLSGVTSAIQTQLNGKQATLVSGTNIKTVNSNSLLGSGNVSVGTVTSVAAGNGMNFTTFTSSGTITLGTPSSVTNSSTNSLTANSHTHAVSGLTTSNLSATAGITNSQLANSSTTINGTAIALGSSGTITANTPNSHTIKFDTGTTEGTNLYTFNGSASKTIDIKAGTNVTFAKSAGSITINASGGSGTVTSVAAGNGMNFTTITSSGTVTMGTPSSVTNTSTNSLTANSHTHAVSGLTTGNLSATAGITNAQLANSAVTIGTTAISLGASSTTLAGLTSVGATTFTGALSGNASTASQASQNIVGTCATAQATVAKDVALANFTLVIGTTIQVRFTNAAVASATLNVNSTGAKVIYAAGAVTTASTWGAGDIVTLQYDGTYWQILYLNADSSTTAMTLYGNATSVSNGVYTTGNQTIGGIKTFSSSPIVPAPTTDLQAATKKYVDDKASSDATYIITNQTEFNAWVANTVPGSYTYVKIKAGTYTLTNNTTIDLYTLGTRYLEGDPNGTSQINTSNYNSVGNTGAIANNRSFTDGNVWIKNITVVNTYNPTSIAAAMYMYTFYNCANLTNTKCYNNCSASTSTTQIITVNCYKYCYYLNQTLGFITSSQNNANTRVNAYPYCDCIYLNDTMSEGRVSGIGSKLFNKLCLYNYCSDLDNPQCIVHSCYSTLRLFELCTGITNIRYIESIVFPDMPNITSSSSAVFSQCKNINTFYTNLMGDQFTGAGYIFFAYQCEHISNVIINFNDKSTQTASIYLISDCKYLSNMRIQIVSTTASHISTPFITCEHISNSYVTYTKNAANTSALLFNNCKYLTGIHGVLTVGSGGAGTGKVFDTCNYISACYNQIADSSNVLVAGSAIYSIVNYVSASSAVKTGGTNVVLKGGTCTYVDTGSCNF